MKKTYVILLLSLCFLLASCQTRIVILPVPANLPVTLAILLDPGTNTIDETGTVSGGEVEDILRTAFEEADVEGFEFESIDAGSIEGMSFTILSTDQTHAVMTGFFTVTYRGVTDTLFALPEDFIIGNALNLEEVIELNDGGVAVLQAAITDILDGDTSQDLTVHVEGSVLQPVGIIVVQLNIGITVDVEQEVDVFDPF